MQNLVKPSRKKGGDEQLVHNRDDNIRPHIRLACVQQPVDFHGPVGGDDAKQQFPARGREVGNDGGNEDEARQLHQCEALHLVLRDGTEEQGEHWRHGRGGDRREQDRPQVEMCQVG